MNIISMKKDPNSNTMEAIKGTEGVVGQLIEVADLIDHLEKQYDEMRKQVQEKMKEYGVKTIKLNNGRSVCLVEQERKSIDKGEALKFLADHAIDEKQYMTIDTDKFKKDFPDCNRLKITKSEYVKVV